DRPIAMGRNDDIGLRCRRHSYLPVCPAGALRPRLIDFHEGPRSRRPGGPPLSSALLGPAKSERTSTDRRAAWPRIPGKVAATRRPEGDRTTRRPYPAPPPGPQRRAPWSLTLRKAEEIYRQVAMQIKMERPVADRAIGQGRWSRLTGATDRVRTRS